MHCLQSNHSIRLASQLTLTHTITHIATILYHSAHREQVEGIVGTKMQEGLELSLTEHEGQFWVVRGYEQGAEVQGEELERIMGLGISVVCLQLPNDLQALVEKHFCSMFNSLPQTNQTKLLFIKSTYRSKSHTHELKYCESIPQALALLEGSPMESQPIRVIDILQIFDCTEPQQVLKLKLAFLKFAAVSQKEEKTVKANQLVFSRDKTIPQIRKEIQKLDIPRPAARKLQWKLAQLDQFAEWLEEQNLASRTDCSGCSLRDLSSRVGPLALVLFRKQCLSNSFAILKKLYDKIAHAQDILAIECFRCEYKAMQANILKLHEEFGQLPHALVLAEMKQQLDSFYQYHQKHLRGQGLSTLTFLKNDAIYRWKYNNRFYKKAAAFFLFLGLAYCQDNLIRGVTVFSFALIALALRC